jgi:hypothetical protein
MDPSPGLYLENWSRRHPVFLVSATKFSPAATVPRIIAGAVLDVVLGTILLSLTMNPDFAMAVCAANLGAIIDQAHLAGDPVARPLAVIALDEDIHPTLVHLTGGHVHLP